MRRSKVPAKNPTLVPRFYPNDFSDYLISVEEVFQNHSNFSFFRHVISILAVEICEFRIRGFWISGRITYTYYKHESLGLNFYMQCYETKTRLKYFMKLFHLRFVAFATSLYFSQTPQHFHTRTSRTRGNFFSDRWKICYLGLQWQVWGTYRPHK